MSVELETDLCGINAEGDRQCVEICLGRIDAAARTDSEDLKTPQTWLVDA